MSSDTTGLGSLGSSADRIRSNYRVDLPALRPDATAFERSSRDSISRNGEMAARDAAIAEAAYGVTAQDRKSTRLHSSHSCATRMPSSTGNKTQVIKLLNLICPVTHDMNDL